MSVKKSDKRRESAVRDPDSRYRDLLDIRKRIQFHQAMGIEEYPRNDGVESFLKMSGPDRIKEMKAGTRVGKNKPAVGGPEENEGGQSALAGLEQEIRSCTLCRLAANRQGTVSSRGKAGSGLMVVGDWSRQEHDFNEEVIFGREEDGMFWKMMAAIRHTPETVYVANCLKCCPGEGALPDRACEESCFSFLEREIAAVKPRIICAMGDVAVRQLTGSSEPLARLRGKRCSYRYRSEPEIMVIPTYHPHFLLQNIDMKKATWLDLQAVEKRLRLR